MVLNKRQNVELFINFKEIFKYLFLSASLLSLGSFVNDAVVVLFFLVAIFLLLTKNNSSLVLWIILWTYLYNFFIGQNFILNNFVGTYLIKGQLYITILFVVFFRNEWLKERFHRQLFIWLIVFYIFIIISDILHSSLDANFFNQATFILAFFFVYFIPRKKDFNNKLFNLLISIGIIQLVVSVLQVNQIIPPSTTEMTLAQNKKILWVAGLDDVASGTFGAAASNVTSWFETILFLFVLAYGIKRKKNILILISFLFLFHYTTVDSKTALGVTIISAMYILQKFKLINLIKFRNIVFLFFFTLVIFIYTTLIKSYYEEKSRVDFIEQIDMVSRTFSVVINNIGNWGKISGYKNITIDHLNNNPAEIIVGYGRKNFEIGNNAGRIEAMDVGIMRINNITRSRSAFISVYGRLGALGLIMMFVLLNLLRKEMRRRKFNTTIGISFHKSGPAILLGSIIFMFLYGGHSYTDLAFLLFFILFALVLRVEKDFFNKSRRNQIDLGIDK